MAFTALLILTFALIGRPQDAFPELQAIRPAVLLTAIAVMFSFFRLNGERLCSLFTTAETKKYLLFYFLMAAGIPFAYYRLEALDFVFRYYSSCLLFYCVLFINIDSLKKLKTALFAICVSTLFYSLFSLAKGSFAQERFSFGTMYDPNDLAYFLISLFPLSLFYLIHNGGRFRKITAVAAIGCSLTAAFMTGSRGGLIGLLVVIVVLLYSRAGRIRWTHAVFIAMVISAFLLLNRESLNMDRYRSFGRISADYNITDEFGRLQIWKKGLQLTLSNPITGVGVNCFSMAVGYLREAEETPPAWQVSHNSYIQVAAEVGLIGFIVFLSIIWGCFKNFSHCRKGGTASAEANEVKTIAGLLQAGFAGNLAAAFFLSQSYSVLFPLFFAFSALLRKFRDRLQAGATPD